MKTQIKMRDDLHKEIHADAVKQAEDAGLPMPHIHASHYDHYRKCHNEAVAHFRGMHPKMDKYLELDRAITQARVDRHKAKSVTAKLFDTLSSDDDDDDEYKGIKHKPTDYGMSKTLKHVNPTLPHKNPKTAQHITDNINHLKKLSSNNKKQIDHHEFEHKFAKTFSEKVLPKWHKMGYDANKKQDIADAAHEVKFHGAKLAHYTKQHEHTVKQLEHHKALLKAHTPSKTPVKRKFLTKLPAEPAQVTAFDLVKDENYFKRKAKLIHLEIDHAVKLHMKDNPAQFSNDFEAEYQRIYHKHPKYKLMRNVVKKHIHHSKNMQVTATLLPYHNLMYNIYTDVENKLKQQGVDHTTPEYDKKFEENIRKHPSIMELEFLRRK